MSGSPKFTQEQIEAIIKSIYNGVIAINHKGIVTIFNPTAERILGIAAGEALGKHIEDVIPDSGLIQVLQTGEAISYQKQKVGDALVVTNRTTVVQNGKLIGAISVFEDITKLEQMAGELDHVKQLKATLDDVIENPYEGIIVVDKNGLVTMINDTYLNIVGRKREEVLGTHISLINENCNLPQVLKTGEPTLVDYCSVRDQGLITMRVPITRDGEMIGAFGKTLFTDINVARVLNEKLNKLEKQLDFYREEYGRIFSSAYGFEDIIGQSDIINSLKNMALRVAPRISTVLITGESGTGKELFAHAIHRTSDRRKERFVTVNCAAIPDNLLESELFGYAEGAFTGAKKGGKPGKFELANRGTIFLDEIGDMPLAMQAKLLRVLQDREVERVGGIKPVHVDVRVIAATNRNVEEMVEKGEFREDLYYRLNIIELNIPPLRDHIEDIALLVESLLAKLNIKLKREIKGINREAIVLLQKYHWPGNIRELENMLEVAVNMTEGHILECDDFPYIMKKAKIGKPESELALRNVRAYTEKQLIIDVLKQSGGDKKEAAARLSIHPSALYRKLKKYEIK